MLLLLLLFNQLSVCPDAFSFLTLRNLLMIMKSCHDLIWTECHSSFTDCPFFDLSVFVLWFSSPSLDAEDMHSLHPGTGHHDFL